MATAAKRQRGFKPSRAMTEQTSRRRNEGAESGNKPLYQRQQRITPPGSTTSVRRKLCGDGGGAGDGHHCFDPDEKNVFSPPTTPQVFTDPPTPAPSISPQPTSFRADPTNCVADGQGNYGQIDVASSYTVNFRYQVETTDTMTAYLLNVEVLQDVEKAISDRFVERFFLEQCSPPPIDVFSSTNSNAAITSSESQLSLANKLEPVGNPFPGEEGGLRKLRLLRSLKSEDQQALVGLSAAPLDQVLEGDEAICPFPTTDGPCFVIVGGVTVFGDDPEGNSNGLQWVDEEIQEELLRAMDSGELEQQVQKDQPDVLAIRYIAPGTPLPNPSTNPDGMDKGFIGGGRTAALSWVLIGLGLFIMAGVFVYMAMARRRYKREQEEQRSAAVAGGFPIVVTQQNVAQTRNAHNREVNNNSGNTIYREISKRYSISSEMPGSRSVSDGGSSAGDENPLLVFQDDDASPRSAISTSWRDQILRDNNGASSLDPNRPFVRPVLDDENQGFGYPSSNGGYHSSHSQSSHSQYHSAVGSQGCDSSHNAGSSCSSSPRSPRPSPSSRNSPSKLTVAFDSSEII